MKEPKFIASLDKDKAEDIYLFEDDSSWLHFINLLYDDGYIICRVDKYEEEL